MEDIFKNCKNWTLLLLLSSSSSSSSSSFPLCMIFTIIYTKTNHVSTEYSVAAILQSLFLAHTTRFAMLNLLYFYTSTFRSMCAVPSTAVFCSSLISCFPCIIIIIRRCNDRYCSRSAQLQGYTATSRDETELFEGKTTQRNYRVSCVVIQNTSTLLLRQSATVHAKCNNTQSAVATGRQANCIDTGTTRGYFGAQF
jgi:hypothetical protein